MALTLNLNTGAVIQKIHTTPGDLLIGENTRYDTQHDANMRLAKSIVRLNGAPIFIKECPDMWCIAWDLIDGSGDFLVNANDKRLDISSPPLGYINYSGSAQYAMRNATRSQKQGIDPAKLAYLDVKQGPRAFGYGGDLLIAIGQSIRNEFPSLLEGMKRKNGFAISRTWAFGSTKDKDVFLLYHRQYPVALYRHNQEKFLFQRGELSKIRRESLLNTLARNGKPGVNYRVEESA